MSALIQLSFEELAKAIGHVDRLWGASLANESDQAAQTVGA